MAGINIDVAVNSRAAVGGVKDLSGALDDTADALDGVVDASRNAGRDGDKAMSATERSADDATDAVQQLERNFRELTQATKRQDDAADKAGKSAKGSFHEAGGAAGEFKDEALQNFSEVTSSFDGSMQSVVDLAQGTFGGLAALGGPIGLALGGLAALTGVAFAGLASSADASAQEATERIQKMYDDMVESGNRFVSDSLISDSIKDTIENEQKLADVRNKAAEAGVSVQTALRAEAGDRGALNSVLDAARQKYDDMQARIDTVVRNGGTVSGELRDQSGAAADLVQHYQNLIDSQDTAAGKADLYRQATSNAAAATADATKKAADLKGVLDSFHDVNVKINVDDAQALERRRQLGEAINVDMFVTPRTGRGIN